MRNSIAVSLALLVLGSAALAQLPDAQAMDWKPWRSLPVLAGGRQKPLDTLARESLRAISNRSSFADPESGETLDATAWYLTMLFDWQADRPAAGPAAGPHGAAAGPHGAAMSPHGEAASPHGAGGMGGAMGMAGGQMSRSAYFRVHLPDKWDQAPLIPVDSVEVREALEMPADQKYISPWDLAQAKILDPKSQKKMPFMVLMQQLSMHDREKPTAFETGVLATADRLKAYQELRMGLKLNIVPIQDSEVKAWASLASLLRVALDDRTDPTGSLRQVKEQFEAVRAAYRDESPEAFDEASAALFATLREVGPELGDYPSAATIDLEVDYNRWAPFHVAWILTALAGLCALLSIAARWKPLYWVALASFIASLIVMLVGFAMRTVIADRAPVTSMYETVIFVACAAVAMGLICAWLYRQPAILPITAAVATLLLVLADSGTRVMNADIEPLKPILRDNFWLIVHVKVIMLSYAAFALAVGIGNVTLGYFLVGSKNRSALAALSKFTYRTLQAGVFLLAAGTITGAMWGDYAWGRFWGWDRKEVWALVSLLAYTAVLHARYVGWVGHRALAALSVGCFASIIVTWYVVNFLMGPGLHSYGSSGNSGWPYVAGALAVQSLYVGIALLRSTVGQSSADSLTSSTA